MQLQLARTLEEKAIVRGLANKNNKVNFDVKGAKIEKDVLYLRKDVCGLTGIQQLIKPQDTEKDGVRNIDSARLPGGTAFLVTGILISLAVGEQIVTEEDLARSDFYASYSGKGPYASLQNSELSIKVQGEEKTKNILRHMMPVMAGDDITTDAAYKVSPFVIPPNQTITPELNIFNPVGMVGDTVAIEVAFVGYKITENHA